MGDQVELSTRADRLLSENIMPKPLPLFAAAESWQASHLQLVAFPTEIPLAVQQNWFHEISGAEPTDRSETISGKNMSVRLATLGFLTLELARVTFTIVPP